MDTALTPELLLKAYCAGIFPMADSRETEEIFWVDPKKRGVFPLEGFHISRSLRKRILSDPWDIRVDTDFEGVVAACAEREETWINHTLFDLYAALHDAGFAHALEVWEGRELVGGVYGVTIGGAFFGESMFSKRTDASKVALAYVVDRLKAAGFRLFDTQFISDHLASLGAVEISRSTYHAQLEAALQVPASWRDAGPVPDPQSLMQRSTQTS